MLRVAAGSGAPLFVVSVRVGVVGVGGAAGDSVSRKLQLMLKMWSTGGRIATNVAAVANFGKVDGEIHFRHLITTFVAHQKFATLSSNNPRENGKMRCSDCAMSVGNARNMNGANRTRKATIVVPPIFAR